MDRDATQAWLNSIQTQFGLDIRNVHIDTDTKKELADAYRGPSDYPTISFRLKWNNEDIKVSTNKIGSGTYGVVLGLETEKGLLPFCIKIEDDDEEKCREQNVFMHLHEKCKVLPVLCIYKDTDLLRNHPSISLMPRMEGTLDDAYKKVERKHKADWLKRILHEIEEQVRCYAKHKKPYYDAKGPNLMYYTTCDDQKKKKKPKQHAIFVDLGSMIKNKDGKYVATYPAPTPGQRHCNAGYYKPCSGCEAWILWACFIAKTFIVLGTSEAAKVLETVAYYNVNTCTFAALDAIYETVKSRDPIKDGAFDYYTEYIKLIQKSPLPSHVGSSKYCKNNVIPEKNCLRYMWNKAQECVKCAFNSEENLIATLRKLQESLEEILDSESMDVESKIAKTADATRARKLFALPGLGRINCEDEVQVLYEMLRRQRFFLRQQFLRQQSFWGRLWQRKSFDTLWSEQIRYKKVRKYEQQVPENIDVVINRSSSLEYKNVPVPWMIGLSGATVIRLSNTTLPRFLPIALHLKELHVHRLYQTALPVGFDQLTSLTKLSLLACVDLVSLPERIGDLTSLTELKLDGCGNLTSLPDSIGDLKSLTLLDLGVCRSLVSLPERIGDLKSLIELSVGGCTNLTSLPERIGDLTSLTKLDLSSCEKLISLPKRFGELKNLKELIMGGCPAWQSMPPNILNKLKEQGCVIKEHWWDLS